MKLIFAIILMTYSFSALAQMEWSCQVGDSQFSFQLAEEGTLLLTETNSSISAQPETRKFSVDPAETFTSEFESSVAFRQKAPKDLVYGEQIVLFSTTENEWSSFYYAYTIANDPQEYIYEYDFNGEASCDLSQQKVELARILGKLSQSRNLDL